MSCGTGNHHASAPHDGEHQMVVAGGEAQCLGQAFDGSQVRGIRGASSEEPGSTT